MSIAGDEYSGSRPKWVDYLLVAAAVAVIALWRLGDTGMNDQESRLALAARAMADENPQPWLIQGQKPYEIPERTQLNRFMVPVENGLPRLVKTPLAYWTAVLASKTGLGVTDFSVRLPSALGGILLGWVTLALGGRMFSRRAALMGALMLVTCVGLQKFSRNARPEMLLCLFCTIAMASFYIAVEAKKVRVHIIWMGVFWVAMGLGNLTKEFVPLLLSWSLAGYVFWRSSSDREPDELALGKLRGFLIAAGVGLTALLVYLQLCSVEALAGIRWWAQVGISSGDGRMITMAVLVGGPLGWYFLRCRAWGATLRLLPTALPGVALMFAIFLPWMIYMHRLFPGMAGGVFSEQVTQRAAGSADWAGDSPMVYFNGLLTLSLPWVLFLPGAFACGLMRRFQAHRRELVYLLLWCIGPVLLFCTSAGKREHYIFPIIPPLCLLMGFIAEDVFFKHKWIKPALARVIGVAYGAVGPVLILGAAALWFIPSRKVMAGPMMVVAVIAGVVFIAAGWLAWRQRFRFVVGLIALATLLGYVGWWQLQPRWDERAPIRDFALEAAKLVPDDAEVYHLNEPQSKTVFYFGRYIPAAQWRFMRSDPNLTEESALAPLGEYLRANPLEMPWMFGYSSDGKFLEPLGYEVYFQKQSVQEHKLLFTLYKR